MLDVATLKLLSRAEIQKLARANHIKANLKTVTIIELLVERSKNNEISGSVAVPTRATKVEPADPPIPEPEQPPPVEHSSNMDYGESISAGMRALRVLDGDTTNRRDGCGSEPVYEPDNENYAEIAARVPDTTTSCGESSSIDGRRLDLAPSLPSTGGQESSGFISAADSQVLADVNALLPSTSPNANVDNLHTTTLTPPGTPATAAGLAVKSPSADQPNTLIATDPISSRSLSPDDSKSRGDSSAVGTLSHPAASPVSSTSLGRRPSPPSDVYRQNALRTSSLNGMRSFSPLPRRRHMPSSPLPPSSPPRSSPQPKVVGELRSEEGGALSSSDDAERNQNCRRSGPSTFGVSPVAKGGVENSLAGPQAQAQSNSHEGLRLREPDSGDSAYSNGDNFYRAPPSEDSVNPEPMCAKTYQDILRTTKSLSESFRDVIVDGQNTARDVHSAEMDAYLSRHKLAQERGSFWRMYLWTSTWTNPAMKWNPEALWKQPMNLIFVGGKYVEVDSDDPRLQVQLPRSGGGAGNKNGFKVDEQAEQAHGDVHRAGVSNGGVQSSLNLVVAEQSGLGGSQQGEESSSPSVLQKYMIHRAVSEPTRSPELLFSPQSQTSAVSEPLRSNKRPREDTSDAVESEQRSVPKIARRGDYSITSPLNYRHNSSDDQSESSSPIIPTRLFQDPASPSSGEEDYVDEKSVESILDGLFNIDDQPNGKVKGGEQRDGLSFAPFLNDIEDIQAGVVEVVDEEGERHRRYSAASKGKGRATV